MSIEEYRSRSIRVEIRHVPMREWDPIGVREEPNAQDEYDSYIDDVFALIVKRASENEIAKYLLWVETERMGLNVHPTVDLLPIARTLLAIDANP